MKREWKTIKQYEEILFEQYGGIARITINRERYRNAFTPLTTAEMSDALRLCREMQDVAVVVLTGAGDVAFCAGGDMNALWMNGDFSNLRILLLNNGTGGIFKTLPTPKLDCVEGTHDASAEAWVKDRGFRYIPVTNEKEWETAMQALCHAGGDAPIFVEAFTDSQNDAAILKYFYKEH